jgi:uncharacterized membrane protein (UPF0127 family)
VLATLVVAVERLFPWRVGRCHDRARAVLELPAGAAGDTREGDRVEFVPPLPGDTLGGL